MKAEFPPHSNVCATRFTMSKLIQEAYFPWYMPQGGCHYGKSNYWSEMLLGLCISYANTPECFVDKNTFSLIQRSYKSSDCMRLAWVIFKQPCKIRHRFQYIVCLISWCWHFSSIKMSERHVFLKAQVVVSEVLKCPWQVNHMLVTSQDLCRGHSHRIRIQVIFSN